MPIPPISASRMATPCVSDVDQRLSSTKATVRHTMPASTTMRYPIRSTRRALVTDIATQPSVNGISTIPAAVADMPLTSCRKSGTNEIAPNIAMPARNPVDAPASTMRWPNMRRGTMGSAARRSTRTNATRASTDSASSPSTSSPVHLPTRPASITPIKSADTPSANRARPV
jgi:hypothetical protein